MKDLSIMHALLQYATNVGSYMCLLHTLPATQMSIQEMTSFKDFRASLPRHEVKGVKFHKWIKFYLHYFQPALFVGYQRYDNENGARRNQSIFELTTEPLKHIYQNYDTHTDEGAVTSESEWRSFVKQIREAGITDELVISQLDGAIRDQFDRLVETYAGKWVMNNE